MAGNIHKHSPESTAPVPPSRHPLMSLREEVDRLFDSFLPDMWGRRMLDMDPFRRLGSVFRGGDMAPEVDVKETEDRFQIAAELPGMDENDVQVTVREGMLTIAGEKRMESEENKADYHLSERSYGKFERAFRLPETADLDAIQADFAKGVLTVSIPKRPEAVKQEKKIEVKAH